MNTRIAPRIEQNSRPLPARPQFSGHLSQPPRTIRSGELFAGTAEVLIDHDGAIYRLKITRQGKLILNK